MSSLLVAYGLDLPGSQLLIEQTAYAPYTGRITKLAMGVLLSNLIYGREDALPVDCGFDGDAFIVGLLVYPRTPELQFTMYLSHGSMGVPAIEESVQEEIINLRLETKSALKYPVLAVSKTEWLGDIYDKDFNLVPAPLVAKFGDGIVTAAPVYGSVRVTYTSLRYSYPVTIASREESIANKYSSVAFGVYSGGVDWLELSAPPGAEEFDGDCRYGGSTVHVNPPDDPDDDGDGGGADRLIKFDYCTRELISDTVTPT